MTVKIKICEVCTDDFEPNSSQQKYCTECSIDVKALNSLRKKEETKKKTREKLDVNFNELKLSSLDLLPKNFNKKSPINSFSYTNHFRVSWYDILKHYNKLEELTVSLKEEYLKNIKKTGNVGLFSNLKEIGIDANTFTKHFNPEEFRLFAGTRNENTTEEYRKSNFYEVVKNLGRLPLTNEEFNFHSNITLETYAKWISTTTRQLESVIQFYISTEEFEEYKTAKEKYTAETYKVKSLNMSGVNSYSESELLDRIKNIIDDFIGKYGITPSQREFEILGRISLRTIKERLNMTLAEVMSLLGYEVFRGNSKERIVIESISKIINEESISQATFDWLKGAKGGSLRCDGFYANYKLVVEYDGEQHFFPVDFAGKGYEWALERFKEVQINDQIKNTLIPQQGITLIRIAYDEPYYDEDFLRMRLIENGIFPMDCVEITSSQRIA